MKKHIILRSWSVFTITEKNLLKKAVVIEAASAVFGFLSVSLLSVFISNKVLDKQSHLIAYKELLEPGWILTIFILSQILTVFSVFITNKAALSVGYNIGTRLFSEIANTIPDRTKAQKDDAISIINNETMRLSQSVILPAMRIVSGSILLLVYIVGSSIFLNLSQLLNLALLALLFVCIILGIRQKLKRNSENLKYGINSRTIFIKDFFDYDIQLFFFKESQQFKKEITESSDLVVKALTSNIFLSQTPKYLIESVIIMLLLTISLQGDVPTSLSDNATTLIFLMLAALKLLPAVNIVFNALSQVIGNNSAFLPFLDSFEKLGRMDDIQKLQKRREISCNNLSLKIVIQAKTYEVSTHGLVGIFGDSGIGKTTLLKSIMGISQNYLVTVNGANVYNDFTWFKFLSYLGPSISDRTSYLSQFLNYKNLNLKTLNEELMSLKLNDVLTKRQILGEEQINFDKLSFGEKQRLGLLKLLYTDSQVLCCDEIFSNLDSHNSEVMIKKLREIADTRLVFIVTHERKVLEQYCDKIIDMNII
jgi:ABC-type lipoprotein export system ATPase subunit